MSYDFPAAQILADGVNQAIRLNAPADMIARLRGAHAYCSITGTALRDETMGLRKLASIQLVEVTPQLEANEPE